MSADGQNKGGRKFDCCVCFDYQDRGSGEGEEIQKLKRRKTRRWKT